MNSFPAGDKAGSTAESPAPTSVAIIDSLSHDGRGVAHIDGKAVFIDGALPGERVRLRMRRRRRSYDLADLVEVLVPSPDRRAPGCAHFGVCGGCSLQHLESGAQIRAKQATLAQQFKRIGKVEPLEWLAPVTGPEWGYRRRARLGARWVEKKGGALIGFRERQRSFIAELGSCAVLDPAVSAWIPALRALVSGLSRPDRIPQVEVAVGDNARALVFRHLLPLTDADKESLRAFGKLHDVQVYIQSDGPETAVPLWPETPVTLNYALPDGSLLEFHPTDFIQINATVNHRMIEQALRLLDPQPADRILDLFSGLGNFTLPLARRGGHVLGIEGAAGLVERARNNARANSITNVEFRAADLSCAPGTPQPWAGFEFDKLLLDPPRIGAMEAIRRLRQPLPGKILYVSCDPATLARDSEFLVYSLGYRLASAGVLDMFPHTSHVESMGLFEHD